MNSELFTYPSRMQAIFGEHDEIMRETRDEYQNNLRVSLVDLAANPYGKRFLKFISRNYTIYN